MTSILTAARSAYAAGLCLLPVKEDGSKAPDVPSWTPYQRTRPTPDDMRAWDFGTRAGYGVIGGEVSGRIDPWDFDCADTFEAFVTAAHACGLGDIVARIRAGYEDRTPRGGRRWLVRYPDGEQGIDTALARRRRHDSDPPDKPVLTLIELTTFSVLAPSNGATHPSGGAYTRVSGAFETIASYTADERAALFALARSFDQLPRRQAPPPQTRTRADDADDLRPGHDFNRRATWPDVLPDWPAVYQRGDTIYVRRPGKDSGVSATINALGTDRLHVFTSSTTFDADTSYDKFGAYAVLHHGGDFSAAARALYALGYGTRPTVTVDPSPPGSTRPRRLTYHPAFTRPPVAGRIHDAVLLPRGARDGWFPRGRVHLVGGSSGAGKTTLVVALLEGQARRQPFLGHEGAGLSYLIVFSDRGTLSNQETLERIGLDPGRVPMAYLPVCWGLDAVHGLLELVEAQPSLPSVLFVEGADMLVEDPNRVQVVAPFLSALQAVATHYHLSIILSSGAAKSRPKDEYALKRDRIFGSQAWVRMTETVAVLGVPGDGTSDQRTLDVMHRNAPTEQFTLVFVSGRLVETASAPEGRPLDALTWARTQRSFSHSDFRQAFPRLSGTRRQEVLNGLEAAGYLRHRKDGRYVAVIPSMGVPVPPVFGTDAEPGKVSQKLMGLGLQTTPSTADIPNDFARENVFSLTPPIPCPLSHEAPDMGQGTPFQGYQSTRSRTG